MLAKQLSIKNDRLRNIDIVKVKLIRESSNLYGEKRIRNPQDVVSIAREFLAGEDREIFIAINLDNRKKINSIHVVGIGTSNSAVISPREVFKAAILSNASCIVLAHNHPSGDPEPSPEDLQMTCKLFGSGDLLDIEVLDHIIIGRDKYTNFTKLENGKIIWLSTNFENNQ